MLERGLEYPHNVGRASRSTAASAARSLPSPEAARPNVAVPADLVRGPRLSFAWTRLTPGRRLHDKIARWSSVPVCTTSDGVQIAYSVIGEGSPLVLVPVG